MEEISFTILSEGLGFYDQPLDSIYSSDKKKRAPLKEQTELLSSLPEDEINLEDPVIYARLLKALERPYLGNFSIPEQIGTYPAETHHPAETKQVEVKRVVTPRAVTPRVVTPRAVTPEVKASKAQWEKKFKEEAQIPSSFSFKESQFLKQEVKTTSSSKVSGFFLGARLIDTFLSSLFFFPSLVLFLYLTQSNPLTVALGVWSQILVAFLLFSQVYSLLFRLFCQETFGEFLSKIRLTRGDQKEVHPYILFWRFFISCLTGVVLLPLLQLLFRRDFLSRLTGLYFQKI